MSRDLTPQSLLMFAYDLILQEGWDGALRIRESVISLEIIGGKVWLRADNTDLPIAERLELDRQSASVDPIVPDCLLWREHRRR